MSSSASGVRDAPTRLRLFREALRMSCVDFGKHIYCSRAMVSGLETGTRPMPGLEIAVAIERVTRDFKRRSKDDAELRHALRGIRLPIRHDEWLKKGKELQ